MLGSVSLGFIDEYYSRRLKEGPTRPRRQARNTSDPRRSASPTRAKKVFNEDNGHHGFTCVASGPLLPYPG